MRGRVFLMEFKRSWRGLLIFLVLILIYHAGITALYSFLNAGVDTYEGQDNLTLVVSDTGTANLSWVLVQNASAYTVLKSNTTFLIPATFLYTGPDNSTTFQIDPNEVYYFGVLTVVNNETVLVGITSNKEGNHPLQSFMDNPIHQSIGGGREIRLDLIEGFISIEMFSVMLFIGGIYLVFRSSSSIASDIEGRQLDIVLSAPVSRTAFIVEKLLYSLAITILFALFAGLGMSWGMSTLELEDPYPSKYIFLTLATGIPMFMAFQCIAIIGAIKAKAGKAGFGLALAVMFGSYFLNLVSLLSSKFDWVGHLSISKYWDYNMVLFDLKVPWADTLILCVLAVALAALAVYLFNKEDMPT